VSVFLRGDDGKKAIQSSRKKQSGKTGNSCAFAAQSGLRELSIFIEYPTIALAIQTT
jgi:hypothetical protein